MKKLILAASAMLMLFSCQNEQNEITTEKSALAQRKCASQDVLEAQLRADPTLMIRMNEIEAFTKNALLTKRLVNGKVVIPVVVNVLYRTAA